MTPKKFLIIAIDGGAASGKSSTACVLAERFHFLHADTGSYYRALTAELLHRGVKATDPAAVRAELTELRFSTRIVGHNADFKINGDKVREADIRSAAVNTAVSHFAALPEVRAALLTYQRGLAEEAKAGGLNGLVMEGRDIGSVIFPNADLRFFLHADPTERANRRVREGQIDAVAERDRLDSSRETAPFVCPPGAVAIDSTHLSLAEVVERCARLITARLLGG
ncbi:MAG: (d)CMP kinase [Verrucomicrobiota bacterium]